MKVPRLSEAALSLPPDLSWGEVFGCKGYKLQVPGVCNLTPNKKRSGKSGVPSHVML